MEDYDKDLYFVAVKLFIRDGDKLLIIHDVYGSWDLPGGRIRKDEFDTDLSDVIKRKMREELGGDLKYTYGEPTVFFRVEREEEALDNQKVRIFAVGFDAEYVGGEVKLSDYMDQYKWVDIKSFNPEDYFAGGWLAGVKDYLAKQ